MKYRAFPNIERLRRLSVFAERLKLNEHKKAFKRHIRMNVKTTVRVLCIEEKQTNRESGNRSELPISNQCLDKPLCDWSERGGGDRHYQISYINTGLLIYQGSIHIQAEIEPFSCNPVSLTSMLCA